MTSPRRRNPSRFRARACCASVLLLAAQLTPAALAAPFGCVSPEQGSLVAQPFGYDPGLERRCVRAAKPGTANYSEDLTQCDASTNASWTIANHSGPNCAIGPDGQKFEVNGAASPLRMHWNHEPDASARDRWALRLVTDLQNQEHPCWQTSGGSFTWFALQNNSIQSGVPLPRPDQLEQVVHLYLSETHASALSHSRMGVSAQVFWDGVAHLVEIDLYTSPHWGDAHRDPDVIVSRPLQPERAESGRYVALDGRYLRAGALSLDLGQGREIRVRWHAIFADLIARGLLPAPRAGAHGADGWESTASGDVAVFTEIYKNNPARAGGALATATVRDFRVEAREPEWGSYVGSAATCNASLGQLLLAGSGFSPSSQLQLYNRYHIPIGAPLTPSRRRGERALLFDLNLATLRQQPAFLRVLEPGSGRTSNFARTPFTR
jgi:hypothetical protein